MVPRRPTLWDAGSLSGGPAPQAAGPPYVDGSLENRYPRWMASDTRQTRLPDGPSFRTPQPGGSHFRFARRSDCSKSDLVSRQSRDVLAPPNHSP